MWVSTKHDYDALLPPLQDHLLHWPFRPLVLRIHITKAHLFLDFFSLALPLLSLRWPSCAFSSRTTLHPPYPPSWDPLLDDPFHSDLLIHWPPYVQQPPFATHSCQSDQASIHRSSPPTQVTYPRWIPCYCSMTQRLLLDFSRSLLSFSPLLSPSLSYPAQSPHLRVSATLLATGYIANCSWGESTTEWLVSLTVRTTRYCPNVPVCPQDCLPLSLCPYLLMDKVLQCYTEGPSVLTSPLWTLIISSQLIIS